MSFRTTTADQKFPKAAFWASMLVGAVIALGANPARAADADVEADASAAAQPFASVRMIAFSAPVEGYAVNSRFGLRRLSSERRARMHEGLDFAAPSGTPVLSAAEGEVLRTGTSSSYGRYVEVRHDNGVTSFYAHLSAIMVSEGDRLEAGERLGSVGSTGRSTGPPGLRRHRHRAGRDRPGPCPRRLLRRRAGGLCAVPDPDPGRASLISPPSRG